MCANLQSDLDSLFTPAPLDGYIPVENPDPALPSKARLYYREVGQGQSVVILHGGPDFDHRYLLPDMDRLSDSYHLVYYDQRGRGKSADNVQPEDVTIQSDVEDIDRLRGHFHLDSIALLGHSWGGLLAMEYAIRYPERVSHLILMNTAPASHDDYMMFRQEYRKKLGDGIEEMKALSSSAAYAEGDPDTVAAYYRIHYSAALKQPEHVGKVVESLRASFTKESILKSWAIEDRLMDETWRSSAYDLLPKLKRLSMPTLVIHGDHDFVPIEVSTHVAEAIPGARFALVKECGHFSYLERPDDLRKEIDDFFRST
jgi:proline iminopeptidase